MHTISLVELFEMFPDENAACTWIEAQVWPKGRCCGHCGSTRTHAVPEHRTMPYRCSDCRSYFSVRTGTVMERSKIPLRKWVIAFYLEVTSPKGVSSMRIHRELGISQKSAWFMLHRIREALMNGGKVAPFAGPVEADETYVGGKRANMSNTRRKALAHLGRGGAGKTIVAGLKDRETKQVRAKVVEAADKATLQDFVAEHTAQGATVYTDEAAAYKGLPFHHESVNHGRSEYVRGEAHTNGIESFWSIVKRAHKGTFHKISPKHADRYVQQFAAKQNILREDVLSRMRCVASRLPGCRLTYRALVADNGLASGARPLRAEHHRGELLQG